MARSKKSGRKHRRMRNSATSPLQQVVTHSLKARISALSLDQPVDVELEDQEEIVFVGKDPQARQAVSRENAHQWNITDDWVHQSTSGDGWNIPRRNSTPQAQVPRNINTRITSSEDELHPAERENSSVDDEQAVLRDYLDNVAQYDGLNSIREDALSFARRTLSLDGGNGADFDIPTINTTAIPVAHRDFPIIDEDSIAEESEHTPGTDEGEDIKPEAAISGQVDGFDVLDFDRPSLRPHRQKKAALPTLTQVQDPEIRAILEASWVKDREKKKARKTEREQLRAQGLLGSGEKDLTTTDYLGSKYPRGFSRNELETELVTFFQSTAQQITFPPMDKHARKLIHDIANNVGLRSKSFGSHPHRFIVLKKSTASPLSLHPRVLGVIHKTLFRPHYSRTDRPNLESTQSGKRKDQGYSGEHMEVEKLHWRMNRRGPAPFTITRGGAPKAAHLREGEIVGAAAPELGAKNKGRSMLERMGWANGMPLGSGENKGLLTPITHVVKSSRAGLG